MDDIETELVEVLFSLLEVIQNTFYSNQIKNIFVEMIFAKTKLITVGLSHKPHNQDNFIETFNTNFKELVSCTFLMISVLSMYQKMFVTVT